MMTNSRKLGVIGNATTPIKRRGAGAPRRYDFLYKLLAKIKPGQEVTVPFTPAIRSSAIGIARNNGFKVYTERNGDMLRLYRPLPEDEV
jgi:hypothetical protein